MRAYKFLASGARGRFSDFAWPEPGHVVSVAGPLDECRRGIHACTGEGLLEWLDDELWEVELRDPVEHGATDLMAASGTLVRRVDAWNDDLAVSLTASCVQSVRQHVVDALRQIDATAAADLEAAVSLGDLAAVVALSDEPATTLVAFVVDCTVLASGGRPDALDLEGEAPPAAAIAANVAYVAAHVVGCAAGELRYDVAFAAERERQRRWLRERLAV